MNTQAKIELLKGIYENNNIEIEAEKNIILDLHGNLIINSADVGFTNNGTLEIIDTIGEGKIEAYKDNLIQNNNKLILSSGTINLNKGGDRDRLNGIVNNGNMEINENIKLTASEDYINVIQNTEGKTINMNGGTIEGLSSKGSKCGIHNFGTLNLNGGSISNFSYGVYNNKGSLVLNGITTSENDREITNIDGQIEIKGNTNLNSANGIIDESTTEGKIKIFGGTINSTYTGIRVKNSTIDMTGGTINSSNGIELQNNSTLNYSGNETKIITSTCGIRVSNTSATANINGGTITSTGNYGIYVVHGKVNMTSGQVNVESTYNGASGIYALSANVTITGGNVTANNTSTGNAYGIYLSGEKTKLTLGIKDKRAKDKDPIITGKTYGVYNSSNAEFYFFDGTVKGQTLAISGPITQIEDKYSVLGKDGTEYKESYLGSAGDITAKAYVNGSYYETLQDAVNACTDNVETHIVMANGAVLDSNVTVSSKKIIILDLNGYSISTSSSQYSIINSGKITIIDTSDGKTGSIADGIITGNGTVTKE